MLPSTSKLVSLEKIEVILFESKFVNEVILFCAFYFFVVFHKFMKLLAIFELFFAGRIIIANSYFYRIFVLHLNQLVKLLKAQAAYCKRSQVGATNLCQFLFLVVCMV